eukprot:gene479-748_t
MASVEGRASLLLDILSSGKAADYFGERVSQLQHALQAAHAARLRGLNDDAVLGALLHDVGHLLPGYYERAQSDGPAGAACNNAMALMEDLDGNSLGARHHELLGASFLRKLGITPNVVSYVSGHVAAKRYLVAVDPAYEASLSDASCATLRQQGGPMTADEVKAFESSPLAAVLLQLRKCDEEGKVPGWQVPELGTYRAFIEANLKVQTVELHGQELDQKLLFTPGPLSTSSTVKRSML